MADGHEISDVRLEVLTGVPMKSNALWVVILCILQQGSPCKNISLKMELVVTPNSSYVFSSHTRKYFSKFLMFWVFLGSGNLQS
jgi:hypothetical protein